jgi:hypothetical protein
VVPLLRSENKVGQPTVLTVSRGGRNVEVRLLQTSAAHMRATEKAIAAMTILLNDVSPYSAHVPCFVRV